MRRMFRAKLDFHQFTNHLAIVPLQRKKEIRKKIMNQRNTLPWVVGEYLHCYLTALYRWKYLLHLNYTFECTYTSMKEENYLPYFLVKKKINNKITKNSSYLLQLDYYND